MDDKKAQFDELYDTLDENIINDTNGPYLFEALLHLQSNAMEKPYICDY
jgi:hypothetical protein